MRKERTGISVVINREKSEREAESIIRTYTENEEYLRNLINDFTPANTRKSVYDMSYSELLHYGRVIKGVAMKILNSLEAKVNENKEKQLSLF